MALAAKPVDVATGEEFVGLDVVVLVSDVPFTRPVAVGARDVLVEVHAADELLLNVHVALLAAGQRVLGDLSGKPASQSS